MKDETILRAVQLRDDDIAFCISTVCSKLLSREVHCRVFLDDKSVWQKRAAAWRTSRTAYCEFRISMKTRRRRLIIGLAFTGETVLPLKDHLECGTGQPFPI